MGYYLEDHPPAVRQYRAPRRENLSGLIEIHTAENALDLMGGDSGAENVARFIARRTNYGSYHRIVDRDSIVRLVDFDNEAFHDRFTNRYSIGLSVALRAGDWPTLTPEHTRQYLEHLVTAAVEAAAHIQTRTGIVVPPLRIPREQSRNRAPGFMGHGDSDPGRRSDPGAEFPWIAFLNLFRAARQAKAKPVTNPKAATTGHLINDCLAELDAITYAVRGEHLSTAEINEWTKDLVNKVYVEGATNLGGVTRWAHYHLSGGN